MRLNPSTNTAWQFLVVDDDEVYAQTLSRALTRQGYDVLIAHDGASALKSMETRCIDAVILDLRLATESGLPLIAPMKAINPALRILLLTGYASIATAVEAIKLGATHYLAKPASVAEILTALGSETGDETTTVSPTPLSVDRLEWEHIQKVLAENEGNLSATARALKMHRRTLQRKLAKRPTRD